MGECTYGPGWQLPKRYAQAPRATHGTRVEGNQGLGAQRVLKSPHVERSDEALELPQPAISMLSARVQATSKRRSMTCDRVRDRFIQR